jgi:hypothetical protein
MVTDVVESGLDALRGVKSPNRMTQAASALKQLFGGDPIPQEYERGVEPWDVAKYDVAGSLPAAAANPLRAVASIPAALQHGAGEFVRASASGMPAVIRQKGQTNFLDGSIEGAWQGLTKRPGVDRSPESFDGMSPRAIEETRRQFATDDWIEGPLTKYVRDRMASPVDEVR